MQVVEEKVTLNLPFESILLTFSNLQYSVPNPMGSGELKLLKGIYGVFRPGILTALMGASGAGSKHLLCPALNASGVHHLMCNAVLFTGKQLHWGCISMLL
jgi:predicted ABC-type transport system involved in lysophospholipase L1 biosynthesis ATPase subunit